MPMRVAPAVERAAMGGHFFWPSGTQQVTRSLLGRIPLSDLLAAGAMLSALALWVLALHLLAG